MRDGLALLAILARVRRRLRVMATIEGAVMAAAGALGALAVGLALARWWLGASASPRHLPGHAGLAAAAIVPALIALGAAWGALRRMPLERCARIIDRALGGHDRVLSALALWRTHGGGGGGGLLTPFMTVAIADAVDRGGACAPGALAPLRRPRATPVFAMAAVLVVAAALLPLPARGSRAPTTGARATSPPTPAEARVRLRGAALDPERDQIAEALRAAAALGDPELAALARKLAATVNELAGQGLERGAALDRLADLERRSEEAVADVAGLRQGLEQAGQALQAGETATRDSGRALQAQDVAGTEKSLNDLAARAAEASASERARIAGALDRAGDRAGAAAGAPARDGRPASSTAAPRPLAGAEAREDSAALLPGAEPPPSADPGEAGEERQRRLARDDRRAPRSDAAAAAESKPRGARERRLQRLERELRETASACRADPESCRRKLQRQARELPRMEDEVRSLGRRQRLAEAIRQLRDRLRREGKAGGERAREERRFMRAARGGDGAREHERTWDEDPDGDGRVSAADPDAPSNESAEGDDELGDDPAGGGEGVAQAGGGDEASSEHAATGQEGSAGEGVGSQKGDAPLGERGNMATRGRAREAQVRDGAGPSRSQVIQAAARRGFARTPYQSIYADYQAAVEESLDASAVPPGRRYIVRRYFQLIRPQSSRAPR